MSTVTRKLAAKELFVNRWFIVSSAVVGVAAVLIAATSKIGFNVGSLVWVTTIIALAIMLALYGIVNERKEDSLLFVMSLPLSPADYLRAKQLGLTLCFLIPWLVSSIAVHALVFGHPEVPDGLAPFVVLLCTFLLANFSVVLCGALHAISEAAMSAVIIVTNMGVTLFMFLIGGLDGINAHMWGPAPVWNQTFWILLTVELSILAVAVSLPFFVAGRRRDFI